MASVESSASEPSGSATASVAPGWVMVAVGSIAGTGSWKDRHSARSPLVVNETPAVAERQVRGTGGLDEREAAGDLGRGDVAARGEQAPRTVADEEPLRSDLDAWSSAA